MAVRINTFRWIPVEKAVLELEQKGELLRSADGSVFYSSRKSPHRYVDLRGAGDRFDIVSTDTQESRGEIDAFRAFKETHPGAVYLHRGDTYLVETLDLGTNTVKIFPAQVSYYTRVRGHKETEILEILDEKTAIIGAILFMFYPMNVIWSSYLLTDPPAIFFMIASILFGLKYIKYVPLKTRVPFPLPSGRVANIHGQIAKCYVTRLYPRIVVAISLGLGTSIGFLRRLTVEIFSNQVGHVPRMWGIFAFPEKGLRESKADLLEGVSLLSFLGLAGKQ